MRAAQKLLEAERCSLYLIDKETKELVFEIALGDEHGEVKRFRLKIGQGIAGWVAKEGKPLLIKDVRRDRRWFREVDEASGFVTKSILCVPLKMNEKVIGVVQAINKVGEGSFSVFDVEIFEALARQAETAINNAQLHHDVQQLFLSTVKSLTAAIDAKDPYTRGHSERVCRISLAIARELGLGEPDRQNLELSALLHDIGKIGIPESILGKKTSLSENDWQIIKKHPVLGENIVKPITQLQHLLPILRAHHERVDGAGYPNGVSGEKIPLLARIIAIADTFDAMTSDRPYRSRMTEEEALEEIKKNIGKQFDSEVVEAFLRAYEKGWIRAISREIYSGPSFSLGEET
jgi:putative nucleotidyltransferase with HDIG domain